jgi:hypothetical protein
MKQQIIEKKNENLSLKAEINRLKIHSSSCQQKHHRNMLLSGTDDASTILSEDLTKSKIID